MSCLAFSRLIVFFLFILPCMHAFSAEENFLLINGTTGEIITELGPNIHKQMSPCSTFKIPLSLMGYDAEVLKDETNPTWDFQEGYEDWLISWRAPQSPLSWMKYSCVWYSKVLSLELGLGKIQNYLTSIEYGNQDASGGLANPGPLNPFWINSSIEISPKEQVDFLQKMILAQLPISPRAIQMTRAILFKEELSEGWKLFGKTGWSGSDIAKDGKTLEHSWFVGWIEKDGSFYPFAYLIRDKKINLDQRIPRVKQLLIQSNVMLEACTRMNKETLPSFSALAQSIIVGSLYEHYKGLRYKIIGVARHSETLEELVVYQALYGEGGIWVRPLTMFLENIVINGQLKPRFKLVQ